MSRWYYLKEYDGFVYSGAMAAASGSAQTPGCSDGASPQRSWLAAYDNQAAIAVFGAYLYTLQGGELKSLTPSGGASFPAFNPTNRDEFAYIQESQAGSTLCLASLSQSGPECTSLLSGAILNAPLVWHPDGSSLLTAMTYNGQFGVYRINRQDPQNPQSLLELEQPSENARVSLADNGNYLVYAAQNASVDFAYSGGQQFVHRANTPGCTHIKSGLSERIYDFFALCSNQLLRTTNNFDFQPVQLGVLGITGIVRLPDNHLGLITQEGLYSIDISKITGDGSAAAPYSYTDVADYLGTIASETQMAFFTGNAN